MFEKKKLKRQVWAPDWASLNINTKQTVKVSQSQHSDLKPNLSQIHNKNKQFTLFSLVNTFNFNSLCLCLLHTELDIFVSPQFTWFSIILVQVLATNFDFRNLMFYKYTACLRIQKQKHQACASIIAIIINSFKATVSFCQG